MEKMKSNEDSEVKKNEVKAENAGQDIGKEALNAADNSKIKNILARLRSLKKGENALDNDASDVNFVTSDFIIPSTKEVLKKGAIFLCAILCNVMIIAGIYFWLSLKEKDFSGTLESLNQEKQFVEMNINNLQSDKEKCIQLKRDVEVVGKLLDNHIYWDEFFKLIEKYTLSDVRYESMSIDKSGELKLSVVALDFDVLTEQIKIFNSNPEHFNKVETSGISMDKDSKTGKLNGLKFSISLNLNPDIFYRKE